jgi:hypothetical protein
MLDSPPKDWYIQYQVGTGEIVRVAPASQLKGLRLREGTKAVSHSFYFKKIYPTVCEKIY